MADLGSVGTIHVVDVAADTAWHLDDDTIERIAQRVAELLKPAPLKLTTGSTSVPGRCIDPQCRLCT